MTALLAYGLVLLVQKLGDDGRVSDVTNTAHVHGDGAELFDCLHFDGLLDKV